MNQASKPENIQMFLEDIATDGKGEYIYGYSDPKMLSSLTYGNLAYLANLNYFVFYVKFTLLINSRCKRRFHDGLCRNPLYRY